MSLPAVEVATVVAPNRTSDRRAPRTCLYLGLRVVRTALTNMANCNARNRCGLVASLFAAAYAAQSAISEQSCRDGLRSGSHNVTLTVNDPELGHIERRVLVVVPEDAAEIPKPLVLGFHGQGHAPEDWGPADSFNELAFASHWVMAYPVGLHENADSTWNCGTAGDNSTCLPNTTGTQCKDSCSKLGRCGRCNWASCYDDVAYIQQMLAKLESLLCLNTGHYFVVGESNGAMFIHHLLAELPGRFKAAAPAFGLPLLGYVVGGDYQLLAQQEKARTTSLLLLHDRTDTTIPWQVCDALVSCYGPCLILWFAQGGPSSDGWIYESRDRTVGVWGAIHKCHTAKGMLRVTTPQDGGPTNLACWDYQGCEQRVRRCMYDGGHGDWPDQPRADELVWAFFMQHMES